MSTLGGLQKPCGLLASRRDLPLVLQNSYHLEDQPLIQTKVGVCQIRVSQKIEITKGLRDLGKVRRAMACP